jgi:hypothetical protein
MNDLRECWPAITTVLMRGIAIACVVVAAVGCANNVPQDRLTGPDGRLKGAQPITLENGEAKVNGVVTYPGGDRVDWKVVDLPAGKKGRLELEMKWTTPRPGLQLGFDVFDQWNNPVANAKGSKGRVRDAYVADARGKYFVRVFAKGRGDAGAYKLAVAFKEDLVVKPPDPSAIPDPPRLPRVPGEPCETFDPRDPECKSVCPPGAQGAPPNWKPCIDAGLQQPPPAPPPPPPPPPPPTPAKPITTRVIKVDVSGNDVILTISAGSDQGVDKTWSGQLMRGSSQNPLVGGKITIIRVDKQRTIAKVPLTIDLVTSNPIVIMQP